jgi:putative heme-binding domain-containing protein
LQITPQGWFGDTAQRLLVQRQDTGAIPMLTNFLAGDADPALVIHALRILEALDGLKPALVTNLFRHRNPFVREHALQLVADHALANDPDPHVRFQCALSLGDIEHPQRVKALAAIAWHKDSDRWTRSAVLSSAKGCERELFAEIVKDSRAGMAEFLKAGIAEFLFELGRILGKAFDAQVLKDLRPIHISALAGIAEGYGKDVCSTPDAQFDAEFYLAQNNRPLPVLVHAAMLLGRANATNSAKTLLRLIDPGFPTTLQSAAVKALCQMPSETPSLLRHWRTLTPAVKEATLNALPTHMLLTALESDDVPLSAIDSVRRRQLNEHKDGAIRDRAAKLFQTAKSDDRMKVYEDYKAVLALKPLPQNGKRIFAQHCAPCHRLDRAGVPVGPDLFSIRNQPKEAILLHIIVPEYEVLPGFAGYEVEMKDGRILAGLIAAESPSSITIRMAQGQEETLPRQEIISASATGLSLMPQEMEKNMSRQDMADLVAYLKGE